MRCICRFLVAASAAVVDGVIIIGGPADSAGTGHVTQSHHTTIIYKIINNNGMSDL